MPLVKQVAVKLSEDGADAVKLSIDRVRARAEELGRLDPTVKLKVDRAAASVELALFRADLRRSARDVTADVGLFSRLLGGLRGKGGADGTGGLLGKIGGVAGTSVPLGPLGSAPLGGVLGGLAVAPAFGSIIGGTLGIIPLLAAATLGVGSFGALAIPTFTAVSGAITKISADTAAYQAATTRAARTRDLAKIRDDWKSLTPVQAAVVRGVQGIGAEFSGLARVVGPQVLPVFRDLLPGIKQLIGDMGPFAHEIAPVLDQFARNFSRFTISPGFHTFLNDMLKLSGPAVKTIGEGLGKVAIAGGQLLEKLVQPRAITFLRDLFASLATAIRWTGNFVHALDTAGNVVLRIFTKDIPSWSETGWRAFAHAMDNISHAGDNVVHAVGASFGAVGRVFTVDIPRWVGTGVSWFRGLPGRITGALGDLGGLLVGAGQAIIGGLLSGLKSSFGGVLSWLGGVGGIIAAHKGPLPKDAVLLYPHGQAIMGGLLAGMSSRMPDLAAVTGQATSIIGGVGGYGGGSPGPTYVSYNVNVAVAPNANLAEVGRVTVESIKAFEKRSGASWRR